MAKFIPQTILITGATGGIGSALADRYALPNRTLVLTGRNEQRLIEITERCQQKGAKVIAKAFDITDAKLLASWIANVLEVTAIDLVIANAGISIGVNQKGDFELLEKTTELLHVNLLAVINVIYPIIQRMKREKRGQIALMSSLASYRGLPQCPAYCASKAALRIYGEALRPLLRKDGIHTSVICPGYVRTAMSEKLVGPKPYLMTPAKAAQIIEKKLRKKTNEIIFPKPLKFTVNLLKFLPNRLVDYLLVNSKSYVKEI